MRENIMAMRIALSSRTEPFFARVHEGYLAIAAREPQRVAAVDASGTPGQTHRRIMDVVRRKLKLGRSVKA